MYIEAGRSINSNSTSQYACLFMFGQTRSLGVGRYCSRLRWFSIFCFHEVTSVRDTAQLTENFESTLQPLRSGNPWMRKHLTADHMISLASDSSLLCIYSKLIEHSSLDD